MSILPMQISVSIEKLARHNSGIYAHRIVIVTIMPSEKQTSSTNEYFGTDYKDT